MCAVMGCGLMFGILYGAIVYGARATRPRQEWVQFPRNPFKMGRWRTGLAHRTENPRTSVRLGPDPPAKTQREEFYTCLGWPIGKAI